ncbi:MAG: (4Fe-4S)-binding protein [Methylocystaceae bacterium]
MEDANAAARQIYKCSICGYLYDSATGDVEHGVPAGTPFNELPPDWVCPICGAKRELFNKLEPATLSSSADKPVVKEYQNEDIIVYWYPKECSHAGKCWGGLPQVFDVSKRPWVNLAGSSAEAIIRTIDKCPSHALQYSLPSGSSVDPQNAKGPGSKAYKSESAAVGQIRVVKDGPLLVEGLSRIFGTDGKLIKEADKMVLCRCGKTKNAPFCDGAHIPESHK